MSRAGCPGRLVRQRDLWALLGVLILPAGVAAQRFRQTQADDYTRYELLDPGSRSFLIRYDVSATAGGARYYFNTLRAGSEHTVHRVIDLHTGAPLDWKIVTGREASSMGMDNASPEASYLAVALARPVPRGGQARIRIEKTYRDTASYRAGGDRVMFERLLSIDRNAVVLPPGFELVAASYPVQVALEPDGRVKASFMNVGPAAVPLRIEGRRLPRVRPLSPPDAPAATAAKSAAASPALGAATTFAADPGASERAFEDRDIVYFLEQPETGAFRLYHDYTETRPGTDRYLNVVRPGSRASNPRAMILDTGEELRVETLRGSDVTIRGIDLEGPVTAATEVVVIWFDPVPPGGSVRLRIEETYTDTARYRIVGGELVWDRSFGRPRNTVVLPAGWWLTANAIPAVVSQADDGRIQLRYVNDRPGEITVFLKARRR